MKTIRFFCIAIGIILFSSSSYAEDRRIIALNIARNAGEIAGAAAICGLGNHRLALYIEVNVLQAHRLYPIWDRDVFSREADDGMKIGAAQQSAARHPACDHVLQLYDRAEDLAIHSPTGDP